MIVYADVLVGINILITYILLVCVRVFANIPTSKWGVAVASLLGGFSALIILAEDIGLLLSVGYKLLSASAIVAVAFLPRCLRSFLKVFISFFGVSFLFGGVIFFLQATVSPRNVLYHNGAVYFDMSIKYLIGVVFVIYGVFLLVDYFFSRHASRHHVYTVSVTFRGITVRLRGMVDTGNGMRDAMSGSPVLVADLSSVMPLLSSEEIELLKGDALNNVPDTIKSRYRVLPYTTVKGGGLLGGFVPDAVTVAKGSQVCVIPKSVIAVSHQSLSDGEYDVLLNKNIYDYQWRERERHDKLIPFARSRKSKNSEDI